MPFLRRRGVMASESDIRRHSQISAPSSSGSQIANGSGTASNSAAEKQPKPPSASELPKLVLDLPSESRPSVSADSPAAAMAAINSTAIAAAAPRVPAPPVTPPNDNPSPTSTQEGAMSTLAADPPSIPDSPPVQEETTKHRRFSMLRFRNASDSQLSTRAKQQQQAQHAPPLPIPPAIITTAPTMEMNNVSHKKPSRLKLTGRFRRSGEMSRSKEDNLGSLRRGKADRRMTILHDPSGSTKGRPSITFEGPELPDSSSSPPVYGDESGSSLALPVNRLSESSRSDGSCAGHRVYGTTTTTTQTTHTTTTFFRLPRRKQKQPEPLFPISHLQKGNTGSSGRPSASNSSLVPATPPRASTSSRISGFGNHETPTPSRPPTGRDGVAAPSPARALFAKSRSTTASPATALFRPSSRGSGQSSPTRLGLNRGRSSTMSSLNRDSMDDRLAPPTTRTSSFTGRKSFGDLLSLSRLRQNSDTMLSRHGAVTPITPGSSTSKNNSLQLPRESIVLPERREDDTPAKYLARLEEVVSRSVIASALSKNTDAFSASVLRSYMRGFAFFQDPMDMAIRKLLMEAELPKETQQIDRCLQSFANRYHECNPGIYASTDQAYFIAFSLLILHTDVFNKNNKHKMQKSDYLKNTRGEGIFDEILGVFYDNITYTPFIHVEDDFDINGERIIAHKARRKGMFPSGSPDAKKAAKEPIDPYTLIIDNKLDILRPNLKEVMQVEDHYSYLGTAKSLNMKELQNTFFKTGVLQIVSPRSRPDAFMSEKTATNPEEAQAGIVDIKITKVGLLWRKDIKKKKARSPWQEWGAILTGAQLYFFKNTTWVKNLMHQHETHIKHGNDGIPVTFKPPLEHFKPDSLMSTDGAVALLDASYKKHKHAFTYVRHGGMEEVLLADDEDELNDWLAKLNYAAAFRTSGVRMRGVVGGVAEGQGRRALRRLDSESSPSIQTPTGEVHITRSRIDHQMAQDILQARREIMNQKVADANAQLAEEEKKLDVQLKNAWHLQILAPILPKTREQMLLSAARMAAQLKWTRMEMWRLKCHRDILIMDLEEEQKLTGAPLEKSPEKDVSALEKSGLHREESKASTVVQRSPRSPIRLSVRRGSNAGASAAAGPATPSETNSPMSDVFQTPPTSATAPGFHKHQNSWDLTGRSHDRSSLRKGSVSSAVSSGPSVVATPTRKLASSGSVQDKSQVVDRHDEVDAGERDLLQKAGLLEAPQAPRKGAEKTASEAIEDDDASEPQEIPMATPSSEKPDRDKSKIRRSLQRTLREGAGHLSHHRSSRRGRDSTVASGQDEAGRDTDILSRGSGSFVVHGKKASVIDIGGDLHSFSPDERLRQRRSQQVVLTAQGQERQGLLQPGESATPSRPVSSTEASSTPATDFRAILRSSGGAERRESAASASTATARSFRELHRKYSSAQQAARSSSIGACPNGNLVVPSDEDSDAAVSFSEGRGTPLPPIEPEEGGETEQESNGENTEDESEEEAGEDLLSPPIDRTQFFTPEPPAVASDEDESDGEGESLHGTKPAERIPSPAVAAVSA